MPVSYQYLQELKHLVASTYWRWREPVKTGAPQGEKDRCVHTVLKWFLLPCFAPAHVNDLQGKQVLLTVRLHWTYRSLFVCSVLL